jgi:uncharacterized protein
MILVKYNLKPSKIHGIGVFAVEFIKKDTITSEYREPIDYRVNINDDFCKTDFAKHFGYNPIGTDYLEFAGDGSMFTNHSDFPNRKRVGNKMIAIKDIEIGEELTCNYKEIDFNFCKFD